MGLDILSLQPTAYSRQPTDSGLTRKLRLLMII